MTLHLRKGNLLFKAFIGLNVVGKAVDLTVFGRDVQEEEEKEGKNGMDGGNRSLRCYGDLSVTLWQLKPESEPHYC